MCVSQNLQNSASPCSNFNSLSLGDSRISQRLGQVVGRIQEAPAKSFPTIFGEEKELDAFYRLMNNPRMKAEVLAQSVHHDAIQAVSNSTDTVLAIHDTTEFSFPSLNALQNQGRVSGTRKGFFGHFCLAVGMSDRQILGVLGLHTWSRSQKKLGIRLRTAVQSDSSSEARRWPELVRQVQSQFPSGKKLIHVMDREADNYTNLSQLAEQASRFVIRVKYDRKIQDCEHKKLFDSLKDANWKCTRDVPLQARTYKGKVPLRQKKDFPERRSRVAQLGISAEKRTICRGSNAQKESTPELLELNFVRVCELNAPDEEKPIEWMLVTNEPIETEQDLSHIVDVYRARWTIEEYFKALKTGCAFETRGFESIEALENCLWIFAPIACQIYNLKTLSRNQPTQEASKILNSRQIQILAQINRQSIENFQALESAMLAIAKMGGHLKRNGPPGWQILTRGYEKLLLLEQGWILAHSGAPQ
jgi:hypothetical protein